MMGMIDLEEKFLDSNSWLLRFFMIYRWFYWVSDNSMCY